MITVILIMSAGMIVGYFLRERKKLIGFTGKFTLYAIYLLLFLLGVAIGVNQVIVKNLPVLGLQSLIITLGAVFGSLVAGWAVQQLFFKTKIG